MKKGQVYEGMVQSVKFPNRGIVVVEDLEKTERAVVKNVITGQKIRFIVNKNRSGKAEGRLLEVLQKSTLEIESACKHFATCGGCQYQNLSYEEQLKLKEGQVRELLRDVICPAVEQESSASERDKFEDRFEGIKGSPVQFEYRNKMEFSFGDEVKGGALALGMHRRGSFYDIVSVKECQIVDEDYRRILSCALAYFNEKEVSFYHKMSHQGYLRHLLVRKAVKTREILIDIITTSQTPPDTICMEQGLISDFKNELCKLETTGKIIGILHTTNDSLSDTVKDDGTKILYGRDHFNEELLGLRFKITPFSFFQTNSLGAEVLYEIVREYVGNLGTTIGTNSGANSGSETNKQIIFDLYSGTGTIAQLLAPIAKKVIGVEIVEEAVLAARENAELNGLHNCEFIEGDVLKVLDEIEERPDFIVLDPPRDGIHPKALTKIIDYGVDKIVYISCKPTSLARDLEVFLMRGYHVERMCAVDMFPGTVHVETIVALHRKDT